MRIRPGLDGLAHADLVGEHHPDGKAGQRFAQDAELMGQRQDAADQRREKQVGAQRGPDPRTGNRGERSRQIKGATGAE